MGLCPGVTDTEFNRNSGGGDLKVPGAMIQTADQVVAKALCELKARRKPTVLSGKMNGLFAFLARFRSRRSMVSQMGKMEV